MRYTWTKSTGLAFSRLNELNQRQLSLRPKVEALFVDPDVQEYFNNSNELREIEHFIQQETGEKPNSNQIEKLGYAPKSNIGTKKPPKQLTFAQKFAKLSKVEQEKLLQKLK